MLIFPNAKINIGLYVTEKRNDGFHNIETIFYPTDFSDILEIQSGKKEAGTCDFECSGIKLDCATGDNLIVKAYNLINQQHKLPSLQIYLRKIIPFGAGLGGGSSDAAYFISTINKQLNLGLSLTEVLSYTKQLGSDCSFFIHKESCFAHGRGEIMEPIKLSLDKYRLLIIKPDASVSTAQAYSNIKPQKPNFDLRQLPLLPIQEWKDIILNDFEMSVFKQFPEIADVKNKLYKAGAIYASMSGSGSAVFGFFERDKPIADDVQRSAIYIQK